MARLCEEPVPYAAPKPLLPTKAPSNDVWNVPEYPPAVLNVPKASPLVASRVTPPSENRNVTAPELANCAGFGLHDLAGYFAA